MSLYSQNYYIKMSNNNNLVLLEIQKQAPGEDTVGSKKATSEEKKERKGSGSKPLSKQQVLNFLNLAHEFKT